jgi:hypothetical protein
MTATLLSDFSISLQQRRWACVLDPMLALSEYGLPLVKQLGEIMELWVVREFWNMIDSSPFYQQQPNFFLRDLEPDFQPDQSTLYSQQILRSLQEWDRLRTMTNRSSWNVHFLADVIGESCLPAGIETDLIWRWEALAQNLDHHLKPKQENSLNLAVRDLAALAAARPACILTYRLPEDQVSNLPPRICTTLEAWGVRCQEVQADDPIATIERDYLRQLIVHTGLSKLLWAGIHLAILHLMVPNAATISGNNDWSEGLSFPELEELPAPMSIDTNLWQGAQGFWYAI